MTLLLCFEQMAEPMMVRRGDRFVLLVSVPPVVTQEVDGQEDHAAESHKDVRHPRQTDVVCVAEWWRRTYLDR